MLTSASRIEQPILESHVLQGNPLGETCTRSVTVYLPPCYDNELDQRYPTIYLLSSHGNTGSGLMNWRPWDITIQQQLDSLLENGQSDPMIVVMPDMWTRLGGSQFINSTGIGRYEDYLIKEIIPMIDQDYRTLPHRKHRGVLGRSSGGFGALTQTMHHPEVFSATACHSGDLYWEYTCLPALSKMHQQLEKFGDLDTFIQAIPTIQPKSGTFWNLIMTVCWAAAFGDNPDEPRGFDLPIDPETGALNQSVWERWLTHDPIRKLDVLQYAEALRQMKKIFIDVGQYDEYQLQVGARLLHKKLTALKIPHVYEEYPDGHRGTHYRYANSLAYLSEALR